MTNLATSFGPGEPPVGRGFGGRIPAQSELPIDFVEGDYFLIEGTASINRLPAAPVGHLLSALVLSGAPTLVHSASALIVQGSANYTLAAGDLVRFVSEGDGVWRAFVSPISGGSVGGAAFSPPTDDGAALGTTSFKWSDLFLASGAVVNFNSGDVTITHSANTLSFGGASSGYAFDGLIDASSAAAGQIKFPAAQNASADANTLDDYEEGTFTPTVLFGSANVGLTYTTQLGRYTKVGDTVYFTARVVLSAKGSSTGTAQIGGLPFTSSNAAAYFHAATVQATSMTSGVGDTDLSAQIPNNAVRVTLYKIATGNISALTEADFNNTSTLIVTGHYYI